MKISQRFMYVLFVSWIFENHVELTFQLLSYDPYIEFGQQEIHYLRINLKTMFLKISQSDLSLIVSRAITYILCLIINLNTERL